MSYVRIGRVDQNPPALVDGEDAACSFTTDGKLRVDAAVTVQGAAGGTSSNFNAAFPSSGTAVGASDGANMKPLVVDGSGNLKVNIAAGSSSGTQYADGAARGTATGTLAMGDDGTNVQALVCDNSGRLKTLLDQYTPVAGKLPVDGSSVTQPVSAASLPLPTGAASAANQALGNSSLASIDTKTPALGQAAMAASVPVVIASNQSAVPVSGTVTASDGGSSLTIDDGGGSITVDVSGAVDTELTTADLDLGAGTDTRAVVGLVGAKSGGGVLIPGDATAGLKVDLGADNDVVVSGSVTVSGTVTANAGSGTMAVSAASLPLPSGAATAAKQPALGTAGTPSADVITVQGAASMTALKVDGSAITQPVSGPLTDTQLRASAVPVSAASLPLPTSAATSTKQSDGSQKTQIVDGSGNVIGATANALDVNIKSGSSSGTQYTEADTDASITGTAVMWEDTSDTLRAVSAAKPLPVNIVAGGAGDGAILDGVSGAIKATVLDYTNSNPIAVRLSDTNGDYVSAGAGTQYTEDAAAAADPVGGALILVRADTPAATVSADGDNIAARGTNKGEQYVKHLDSIAVTDNGGSLTVDGSVTVSGTVTANAGSGTMAVSAASLPLPSGAATSAKQDTANTSLGSIDGKLPALGQALATGSVPVVLPAAQITTLTPPSSVGITGSVTVAQATGTNLHTVVDSGTITTITNVVHVDDNASTLSIDDGAGSITVDGTVTANAGTGTFAISAASLPLPTGASTAANQTTGNTSLASIDTKLPAQGQALAGSCLPVVLPASQITTLTPPAAITGYATSAKQSDGSQKTQIVDGSGNVIGATANALDVNIKSGSSAGTQYTEGDIDASITGTAMLWEDTSDTLRSVSAAKPLPVNVVAGGAGDGAILDGVSSAIKATVLDYTNSNPLAVRLTDTAGDYVAAGAGTQYTEDAAAAADPIGSMNMAVRADTPAAVTSTDGDNIALRATNKGELYVKHIDAIPVTDNAGSLTVDNGGTFAVQAAQSGTWDVGTVTTVTNVVHVDDNASTLSIDDGAGSITVDGTVTVNAGTNLNTSALALESGGNLAAVKTNTDKIPSLGQAVMASSVPVAIASNQTVIPVSDNSGSLTVDNAGTFAVQATIAAGATNIAKAEDVASADADVGVPAMAVRKATPANTSGTDGDYEMLQMSAGRLWTSATIDAALPAGTNAIGKLAANDGVDIGDVTINNAAGASAVNIQDGGNSITVDGTVSITANSSVNLAQVAGTTTAVGNGVASAGCQRVTVASDNTAFAVNATLAAETTKVIGTVNVAASQSIAVTQATASSLNAQVVGSIAHDGTDSGNPVKVGGYASSAERTAVASGDRADFVTDLVGKQIVLPYANPENFVYGSNASAITDTTSTSIVAAQGAGVRFYCTSLVVSNSHATVGTLVKITDGSGGTLMWQGYCAAAGGGFSITFPTPIKTTANTALHAVCGTTGSSIYVSAAGYKGA